VCIMHKIMFYNVKLFALHTNMHFFIIFVNKCIIIFINLHLHFIMNFVEKNE
jgi:hypothetical protein